MKIMSIPNCSLCPYKDHTGNIGGNAKAICRHPVAEKERLGTNGGTSNLTLGYKYPKQPKWCPLEESDSDSHSYHNVPW